MRTILVYAIVAVVLALPPVSNALDADAAPVEPVRASPDTTPAAQAQPSSAPLILKYTRLYLGRTVPAGTQDGAASRSLDLQLRPEDVQWLMTQVELRPEEEAPATVEVTGEADTSAPDIPGGIFAPFWALKNLKQAWRIFMPVQ